MWQGARVVNTPETPTETPRSLLPKEEARPRKPRDEEFVPKYVEFPPRRRGPRNLRWGIVALLFAAVLTAIAMMLGGERPLLPLVVALLTFALLWVLVRVRLFRQRNGVFLALALVCLFASFIPLIERVYDAIRRGVGQASVSRSGPDQNDSSDAPLLSRELGLVAPAAGVGAQVRVLKDSRVLVEGKPYLIKTGETFRLAETRAGEAVFFANDWRVAVPSDVVEILAPRTGEGTVRPAVTSTATTRPVREDAAAITQRSQQAAVRRYPALGEKDSEENQLFVETYQDLKEDGSELLEDPDWPLQLADALAKREGWERRDEQPEAAGDSVR